MSNANLKGILDKDGASIRKDVPKMFQNLKEHFTMKTGSSITQKFLSICSIAHHDKSDRNSMRAIGVLRENKRALEGQGIFCPDIMYVSILLGKVDRDCGIKAGLGVIGIEKGVKINKSLSMLEKANKLKSNDPFIIDSLGWALFKLERFEESKEYLQLALRLMPADPIVNDHYGDVLWKNGKKIQARYYWNYVLNLKEAEENLKRKIKKKLIKGL